MLSLSVSDGPEQGNASFSRETHGHERAAYQRLSVHVRAGRGTAWTVAVGQRQCTGVGRGVSHGPRTAAHTGAPVQVISALVPNTMPTYAFDAMPMPGVPVNVLMATRQESLRAQMDRLVPDAPWPVTVRGGDPVREIVRQARETEARVVVVGRGKHDLVERILGGESVLRLLQLGDTPYSP